MPGPFPPGKNPPKRERAPGNEQEPFGSKKRSSGPTPASLMRTYGCDATCGLGAEVCGMRTRSYPDRRSCSRWSTVVTRERPHTAGALSNRDDVGPDGSSTGACRKFEQTAGQEAIYTLSTRNGQGRGWQMLTVVGDGTRTVVDRPATNREPTVISVVDSILDHPPGLVH